MFTLLFSFDMIYLSPKYFVQLGLDILRFVVKEVGKN